jgi:hypothetical protein
MKTVNMANGAQRNCDVGFVWFQLRAISVVGSTTYELQPYYTLNIATKGDTTVHIDGVASITLLANTSTNINVGPGKANDAKRTVTVTIDSGVAAAAVSIASESDMSRVYP